jgi:hypothetical protein
MAMFSNRRHGDLPSQRYSADTLPEPETSLRTDLGLPE